MFNALTPYLLWIKLAAVAALVIGAVVFVQHHDAQIREQADAAGYNRRIAEEAQSAATAQALSDGLNQMAALATRTFHAQLAADLPKIEETSHARTEQIRVIYRDHPVPAQCMRPAGVLQQLEDARAAANAAAGAPDH